MSTDDGDEGERAMSGDGSEDREGAERPPSVRDAMAAEGQRPTPVRLSMDARRDEPEPVELPSTRVRRDDGEEWIVRVEGRAETGGSRDAGAPLLYLTFARAEEPEERIRETIRVGRSLEALSERDLLADLDGARPYDPDWERSALFAGTRKKRGG